MLVTLFLMVSITLTTVDKIIHSTVAEGFMLKYPILVNPLDKLLTVLSDYFPLDYIILAAIIAYFFFATLSGIVRIGIRFIWIHLYSIRPRTTPPQGLLCATMILMFSLLALNMEIVTLAPQYATWGSQTFLNGTDVIPCRVEAPPGNCTMTQIASIVAQITVGLSFFGVVFYWATWGFIGFWLIGLIVAICKRRQSNLEVHSDEDDDY